jgi:hypothetical protein
MPKHYNSTPTTHFSSTVKQQQRSSTTTVQTQIHSTVRSWLELALATTTFYFLPLLPFTRSMAMTIPPLDYDLVEHLAAEMKQALRPWGYSMVTWFVIVMAAAFLLERILAIVKMVYHIFWYPLWLLYVAMKWLFEGTKAVKLKVLAKDYVSDLSSHQQVILHGKHRGMTFQECLDVDPGYLVWIIDHCNSASSTSLLKLKVWVLATTTRADLKSRLVRQTYVESQPAAAAQPAAAPPTAAAAAERTTTTKTTETTVTTRSPSALSAQHLLRRWRMLVIDMMDENRREETIAARRQSERWLRRRVHRPPQRY